MDVINHFERFGGNFSYATARSIVTVSKVTAGLNTEFPVITYNGAYIINNATNETLRSNYFTMDESVYVCSELSKRGVYPIVFAYVDNRERFTFINSYVTKGMRFFLDNRTSDTRRREVINTNELYIGDVFYIACMDTELSLAPINEIFKSDKRYHCIYQKDIYSGAQWCEILLAKATKANAALQLKELLISGTVFKVFFKNQKAIPSQTIFWSQKQQA